MAKAQLGIIAPPKACQVCGAPAELTQIQVIDSRNEKRVGAFSQFGDQVGRNRRLELKPGYRFDGWIVRCFNCIGKPHTDAPIPEPRPMARREDPVSSHEAARAMIHSGQLSIHLSEARRLVAAHPGSTYRELYRKHLEHTGQSALFENPPALMRRLSEVAEKGQPRQCSVSGRIVTTWWLGTENSKEVAA